MTTLYEVRQDSLLSLGDGNTPPNPLLRMGIPAYASKWDLFALGGRMFNLKQTTIGTVLSGATADNGGIVLTVPWVQFSVPTGTTVFPHRLNLSLETAAGTLNEIAWVYTQTDSYTSGGTALTPLNWKSGGASSACTSAVVGPSGGVITEAAMVGVRALYQDVVPAAFAANATDQYTINYVIDDLVPVIGPASVILFLTGASTTPSGFFTLDWAEVDTVNVKAG
jgi:hypothetical protein